MTVHVACGSLTEHLGDDSRELCKHLIEQCPESVRILDNDEWLPIHYLLEHCQHQPVREVVVCLMRAYPESFDMATVYGDPPAPSSIPFIQGIKPLLDEEKEIKENIVYLQEMTVVFQDAVNEGTDLN